MQPANLTPAQLRALRQYADGAEHPELHDFGQGPLAFYAREKVISALMRKGLVDDSGITAAGRAAVVTYEGNMPGLKQTRSKAK